MRDFACRRCGACCRIRDGIVRVSEAEIRRIAAWLGRTEADFIASETELAPDRRSLVLRSRPDGSCAYLTAENRCAIHAVKPDKCRTFPFDWQNPDSREVCPGLRELQDERNEMDQNERDAAVMRRLQETLRARIESGDPCGPFYAAIVASDGSVVAEEANGVVPTNCSHAHAEMNAIAAAERVLGSWNLSGRGLTLYTTAEPCMMCVGGILWSGVGRVVYGVGTADVERITGFDEGFKPQWEEEFARRGIAVTGPVLPDLGKEVLAAYMRRQGVVYSPR